MRERVLMGAALTLLAVGLILVGPARSLVEGVVNAECFDQPRRHGLVALGDSLTVGNGEPERWIQGDTSWVAQATCDGPLRYGYNAGRNGETSTQIAARIDDVLDHRPQWLVVLAGTNDFVNEIDADQTLANLQSIVQSAKGDDDLVVVLGTLPPIDAIGPALDDLNDRIRALAFAEGVHLVDFYAVAPERSDGVHPTKAGAKEMAQAVIDVIAAVDEETSAS